MSKTNSSSSNLFLKTSIAGAAAGFIEHLLTFPFDTIKTRIQFKVLQEAKNKIQLSHQAKMRQILTDVKFFSLYRGLTAILIGAIPSHSVYFATYECSKHYFGISNKESSHPFLVFMSGGLATLSHDSVVTPLDVIKQRMQLPQTKGNFFSVTKGILKNEGFLTFFRSLPTTFAINFPYQGIYFVTYETMKSFLQNLRHIKRQKLNESHKITQNSIKKSILSKFGQDTPIYLLSGISAGGVAGMLSTPLDVAKTYIQTHPNNRSLNTLWVLKNIVERKGIRSLYAGSIARMITCAPAAGICWTSYELMKILLGWEIENRI